MGNQNWSKRVRDRKRRMKAIDRNRSIVNDAKSCGCVLCGYNKCLDALDLHHVGDKSFELSDVKNTGVERLNNELSKCIVVCANCHREIHAGKIAKYDNYQRAFNRVETEDLPILRVINGSA